MQDSGADIKTIQHMCGHKFALNTWDIYDRLWRKHLEEILAKMDAFVEAERSKL